MNASSTLAAVFAEVSMNTRPCSRANASPSSRFTSRRASRSLKRSPVIHLIHEKKFTSFFSPFISNQHNNHIGIGMLSSVFQPRSQMVERISSEKNPGHQSAPKHSKKEEAIPSNVINEQSSGRSTIIRASDRTKRFLTSLKNTFQSPRKQTYKKIIFTVSQIWSLICFPSIVIIRAPNSTPENPQRNVAL